ncbi:MAG TPA: YceI family protein [Candidatus Eisenbacteria bacterium]|nr:YceI family protein [Candidatus Eisenbacteria bacterium]
MLVALLVFFLSLDASVATRPVSAELLRFGLNPKESKIVTKVADPFGKPVSGVLRLRHGEARGDPDRLKETAAVYLTIEAGSYDSGIGARDQDIQEYYLEARRYPLIRFDSTAVQKIERHSSPKAPWQMTVEGRLDLHGVQREVIVPLRLVYDGNRIVAEGSFRLFLEQFKIAVPRLLFLSAGNEVQVDFRIVGEAKMDRPK